MACLSFAELNVEIVELDESAREHLESCHRCRTLRRHLPENISFIPETFDYDFGKIAFERDVSIRPVVGGIYSIAVPKLEEYLLGAIVELDEFEAVIVPIYENTQFATDKDLIVANKDILGYQLMLEMWNHGAILLEQLKESLGNLGELTTPLREMYEAINTEQQVSTDFDIGVPIISNKDPRLLFQAEERERTFVYWQPAIILSKAENVSELIRHMREQLDLDSSVVASIIRPEKLRSLEHGSLDILRNIPIKDFALLLKRLAIQPSKRLQILIQKSIEVSYGQEIREGPVFNRKRRRTYSNKPREERTELAKKYAESVIEELKQ